MAGLPERTIPLAAERAIARHEAAQYQRLMSRQKLTIKPRAHKRRK